MRLTCSCCGAAYSLDVLLADQSARNAVASALALPAGLGEQLLRYLALFRPPQRALAWDRAAKLLAELNADIAAGQIKRDGRIWAAPLDYWMQALDATLAARSNLVLPLKNHGYLYAIIAGISSGAEARAEDAEAARRHRPREGRPAIFCTPPGPPLPAETRRPVRTPPPEEFHALLGRLAAKTAMGGRDGSGD